MEATTMASEDEDVMELEAFMLNAANRENAKDLTNLVLSQVLHEEAHEDVHLVLAQVLGAYVRSTDHPDLSIRAIASMARVFAGENGPAH